MRRALIFVLPVLTLTFAPLGCDKAKTEGGDGAAKADDDDGADGGAGGDEGTGAEREHDEGGKDGSEAAAAKPAKLADNSYKPATKKEAVAAKAAITAKLNEGRKAVKAKNYAEGIVALQEAKKLSPMNGKILGELGWAHFLNGELEAAERELNAALKHVDNPKTKGAVLYNLGRVEEKRGEKELAMDLYRQSVAVRPNDVVAGRLASLGGGTTTVHASCGFDNQGPAPADICHAYAEKMSKEDEPWECEYHETRYVADDPGFAVSAGGSAYETVFTAAVSAKDPYVAATVFSVAERDIMMMESFVVAVAIGDDWWSASLVDVAHPGVGYADESVNEVEIETKDLNGVGDPEVIITWSVYGHDMDPGVEYMEEYSYQSVAVLSVDGGKPEWLSTVRTDIESASGDLDVDTDEWGKMIDSQKTKATATVEFDGKGSLTVSGGAPPSAKTGTFEFAEYPVRCPAEQDYVGL